MGDTGDNFEREANSRGFGDGFAKAPVISKLGVAVGNCFIAVTNPEAQQVLRRSLFPKMGDAESAEGVEATFLTV